MKQITMVLNESDAKAVRRAVCAAGGERVVTTPLPYWLCGVDMVDVWSELRLAEQSSYAHLEVIADTRRSGRVGAAIHGIARAATIALTSPSRHMDAA